VIRLSGSASAALLAAVVASAATAAERLPEWVPPADTAYRPEAADVPAVVLLREHEILVDKNGRTQTRERVAIRCLTTACGEFAIVRVPYLRGTQSVSDLRVFLVDPGGLVRVLGKKDVIDAALDPDDLYDESRIALLSARREVGPGSLVASEWTRRDSYAFPQHLVDLQDRLPVVKARCSLVLPEGWRVDAVTFNHPALEAHVAGLRTTWEIGGLAYRPDEPLAPPASLVSPRLALAVHPASGQEGAIPASRSWDDIGRWASTLFEPAAAAEDAVALRMRELTAKAAGPRERFEAAARFVQNLTYVSIQMDLGRGGGYRPRPAVETLRRGYGDCKDKVSLLRGLLRSAGIATRPVFVSTRDSGWVRREFPSPFWFDHVIIAVAGIEMRRGEPVADVPGTGPLLLFDPTDPFTPPGELPEALWGGLGLAAGPEASALVTIPAGKARLERRLTGDLKSDGSFRLRLREVGSGSSAESLRALARRATRDEVTRGVERWLARSLPGVRVEGADLGESSEGPSLDVLLSGRLPGWQDSGKIAVLRAALIPWRGLPSLSSPSRRSPVVFRPTSFSAEYRLRLPARYSVSEVPSPVQLERSFGRYTMNAKEIEDTLVVTQELQLTGATVPVDRFAEARDFIQAILSSGDAPLVLKRAW
jgi:hypothetical protein